MLRGVCGDFGVLGDFGAFTGAVGKTFLGEPGLAPTFGKTIAPLEADFGAFEVDFLLFGDLAVDFLTPLEPRPEGVFGDLRGFFALDDLRLDIDPRDVGLPLFLGEVPPLKEALGSEALDPEGVTNVSRLVCEYDRFLDDFVGVGLARDMRSTEEGPSPNFFTYSSCSKTNAYITCDDDLLEKRSFC